LSWQFKSLWVTKYRATQKNSHFGLISSAAALLSLQYRQRVAPLKGGFLPFGHPYRPATEAFAAAGKYNRRLMRKQNTV
jgi:hypothetical protein